MLPEAPVLLVDTGNFSDNPTASGEAKTRALLEGMVRLGYQAVNVGERDLASGYDSLQTRVKGLPLKLVSANVVRHDTKQPAFDPYTVLTLKGKGGRPEVRVGVIGVARFNPVFQKAGPAGANLVIQPPADVLRTLVPEVRAKADVVVVLAALHKDDAHALVRAVPGIDLVLGAFANMVTAQDELEGTTHIRYVGNQGKFVGESRVSLSPERKILSVGNYVHQLSARYPDDPATLQWLAGALKKVHAVEPPAAPAAGGAPAGH